MREKRSNSTLAHTLQSGVPGEAGVSRVDGADRGSQDSHHGLGMPEGGGWRGAESHCSSFTPHC